MQKWVWSSSPALASFMSLPATGLKTFGGFSFTSIIIGKHIYIITKHSLVIDDPTFQRLAFPRKPFSVYHCSNVLHLSFFMHIYYLAFRYIIIMFTHCKTLSCMVIKFRKLWLWNMNKYIYLIHQLFGFCTLCTIGNQWEGNLVETMHMVCK